jgi:hypothetical protein
MARSRFWMLLAGALCLAEAARAEPEQFILFNLSTGVNAEAFARLNLEFPEQPGATIRVGLAAIFSYFGQPRSKTVENLRRFLRLALETGTPVLVQLDGENWWGGRADLWNWWDPAAPGYSPSNRENVEWSGWSADDAIRIAWRNWGRQIRVLPSPNLMSARYREASHQEMAALIPVVLDWWQGLPLEKRWLFVGIKVGWESSVGVNAWYYPGGNDLLDRPSTEDPTSGIRPSEVPARGVAQIGYAAVKTAGIRSEGQITESDLAEVVRRHLEDLCRVAAQLGVPREKLFTHGAGWKDDELLYQSPVNRFSCPGWSFYQYAADPGKDAGVQTALARSDAPHWAAVEWLYQGKNSTPSWRLAIQNTLAQPRCRFLCIYNWEEVREQSEAMEAVRESVAP